MQAFYPLKIQAIRSKGQQARLYVYFPLPLAAAISLQAGEEVQWELLDRGELHLVRKQLPPAPSHSKGKPKGPNSYPARSKTDCQKQTALQSQRK